jgi:hypothetical protein
VVGYVSGVLSLSLPENSCVLEPDFSTGFLLLLIGMNQRFSIIFGFDIKLQSLLIPNSFLEDE